MSDSETSESESTANTPLLRSRQPAGPMSSDIGMSDATTRRPRNENPLNQQERLPIASNEHGTTAPNRAYLAASRASGESYTEDSTSDTGNVKYGAHHVIQIFLPVGICMALVVISLKVLGMREGMAGAALPYLSDGGGGGDSGADQILPTLRNVAIILGVIVVMTVLLVLLYKYRCYAVLYGWILIATGMLLFFFTLLYFSEWVRVANGTIDYVTTAIIVWNWGVMGMLAIHWRSPMRVQQFYLILNCVIISMQLIIILPAWTAWGLIGLIALWDLIAVLTPCGPLRILVELAQSRGETIFPSLIYTASVVYVMVNDEDAERSPATNGAARRPRVAESTADADEPQVAVAQPSPSAGAAVDDDQGVKLGLGDFIFYSMLVGKASSSDDFLTVVACFIAILIGLGFTLFLLAIYRKALPALPISILFGLVFYFVSAYTLSPLVNQLTYNQVFI